MKLIVSFFIKTTIFFIMKVIVSFFIKTIISFIIKTTISFFMKVIISYFIKTTISFIIKTTNFSFIKTTNFSFTMIRFPFMINTIISSILKTIIIVNRCFQIILLHCCQTIITRNLWINLPMIKLNVKINFIIFNLCNEITNELPENLLPSKKCINWRLTY